MSKWTYEPGDYDNKKQIDSADIKQNGKSIFTVECGDYFGISNNMAKKICDLLNKAKS